MRASVAQKLWKVTLLPPGTHLVLLSRRMGFQCPTHPVSLSVRLQPLRWKLPQLYPLFLGLRRPRHLRSRLMLQLKVEKVYLNTCTEASQQPRVKSPSFSLECLFMSLMLESQSSSPASLSLPLRPESLPLRLES